jgi:hypothetical protein
MGSGFAFSGKRAEKRQFAGQEFPALVIFAQLLLE